MSDFKSLYRIERLARTMECSPAKAAETARRLHYLGDEDFERYARETAATLATLRARAGVTPAAATDEHRQAKVQAAVNDYLRTIFALDDEEE